MIDPVIVPPHVWWWLAAIMIPTAILTGYRLRIIDQREKAQRLRLEIFRGAIRVAPQVDRPPSWAQKLADLLGPIVGVVEQQRLIKLLAAAGIKGHGNLGNFIAIKALTAVTLVGLAWLLNLFSSVMLMRVGMLGAAFLVGWRLPDFVLNRLIKRRKLRLEQGVPDALDLLVICAEAGLSLNQSVDETGRQMHSSNKEVADELATTSAEMQLLPDVGQALDNLVERTGLDNLGGLVSTLKQSIKFGTPLADSLRQIALEMRAERQARIEQRAARLPVLLAIPMMLFILPCVFMVVGTPVVLRMIDVVKNVTIGAP